MERVSQQAIDKWFADHLWATDERIEEELSRGEITNACSLGHQTIGNYHEACDGWVYQRGRPQYPSCSCPCHKEEPRKRRHWAKYPTIERVQAMFKRMGGRAA